MTSPFCSAGNHFLPDRYVEGRCPHCDNERARGDQCDRCGRLLDPFELGNPACRVHGTPPEPRQTTHAFFRLSAFQAALGEWLSKGKEHWRRWVLSEARSWIEEGLKDRPMTRDLDWGIEVPLPGYETKRLYVWFEAVMGYYTATKEFFRRAGRPDGWKDFWYDPEARHVYFIGKDNVVFHAIIWPAILMGTDDRLVLPFDIPATQFMNISGDKMSASRGRGVWLPDLLERFDPDQIRYYGIATMPELKDTDFEWQDFAQRNNSELLAVYGNFVHRTLTFADKHFGSKVPAAGFLDAADRAILRAIEDQWKKVGRNLEHVHLKDALREGIHLARLGNQYFDQKAPWDLLPKDREACGTAIHVSLRLARALALIMAPFLPASSARLWAALGHETDVHATPWTAALEDVPTEQGLRVGRPLFTKIELPDTAAGPADRLDLRVAEIVEVADHPNADKLYVLQVNLGEERRQIVAGIRADYPAEGLRGRKIALLVNLEPAKLRGVRSDGMLLAGEDDKQVGLVLVPDDAPIGAQILGVSGAPRLTFAEFGKYDLRVGPRGTVEFLGIDGGVRIPLAVGHSELRVDKDLREGTKVH
jgi:methionyl-tRNA synthetase